MSDPTAQLQQVIVALLRADAGVKAAFGGKTVKIYDYPPANAAEPYLVVGEDLVLPQIAGCLDGAEVESTIHIWSKTDPPGKLEAKAIGAAVVACLAPGPDLDPPAGLVLADHRVTSAAAVRSQYLSDPNKALTTHGVNVIRFETEPL